MQDTYNQLSVEDKTGTLGQSILAKQQQVSEQVAAEQVKKEMLQVKFTPAEAKEKATEIAPAIKAGTVEAFKFLQQSQTKQKEQQEIKALQEKLLKEAQEANRLAQTAPRLAFAR